MQFWDLKVSSSVTKLVRRICDVANKQVMEVTAFCRYGICIIRLKIAEILESFNNSERLKFHQDFELLCFQNKTLSSYLNSIFNSKNSTKQLNQYKN